MASPTTLRTELLKVRRGFNDRLFLTLGEGSAGMSPYNPMLLGLGLRLVVLGDQNTRRVRFQMSRIVDDQEVGKVDLVPVKVSATEWQLEGAIGSTKLGFSPNVNFYVPQCYKLDLVVSNVGKSVKATYYFWVAEGPVGSVHDCTDRIMSATGAFTSCYTDFDDPRIAPIIQFGLPDPMTEFFSGSPFNQGSDDPFFSGIALEDPNDPLSPLVLTTLDRTPEAGVYDPSGSRLDPILRQTPVPDPFTRLVEPAAPTPLLFRDLFLNAYGSGYLHVIGDTEKWHRQRLFQVTPLNVISPLPGDTADIIVDDFANGSTIISISTPSPNDDLAILDGNTFLNANFDDFNLSSTITLSITPPLSLVGGYDYVILAGHQATWAGAGTLGIEIVRVTGGPQPYQAMYTALKPIPGPGVTFSWEGIAWEPDPLVTVFAALGGGVTNVAVGQPPSSIASDVIAFQVLIASPGTFVLGAVGFRHEIRVPVNGGMSNVYHALAV